VRWRCSPGQGLTDDGCLTGEDGCVVARGSSHRLGSVFFHHAQTRLASNGMALW